MKVKKVECGVIKEEYDLKINFIRKGYTGLFFV